LGAIRGKPKVGIENCDFCLPKDPCMKKYSWAIIAGVCILALIVVGAVFIPRIFSSSHVEEPMEIVMPGHWWKTDFE
jgi:hypothetical protein